MITRPSVLGFALFALAPLALGAEGSLERRPLPLGVQPALPAPVAGILASTDSPPPSNPFTDLPVAPIVLNDSGLSPIGEQDLATRPMGLPDGRVAVLALEGTVLRAQASTDGGASFSTPVTVGTGSAGAASLFLPVADYTSSGQIYVAWMVKDPDGGAGLQFAASDDMGATWTAPATLVKSGDTAHGISRVRISTGPGDGVAIAFWGEAARHPYALVSDDAGASWSGPTRLDPGAPASATTEGSLDVEITAGSVVHVAFGQDRGSGNRIYCTHSIDGGATWTAETDLSAITPSRQLASNVELETAFDGSVLAAFWDSEGSDHLYVMRSAGGGAFTTTANWMLSSSDNAVVGPRIEVSSTTGTAMVFYTDVDGGYGDGVGPFRVTRSANNGASFAAPVTLAAEACDGFFPWANLFDAEQVDSTWVACWSDGRASSSSGLAADIYCRSSADQGVTWGTEVRVDDGGPGEAASSLGGVTPNGTASLLLAWGDGRDSTSRSFDVYVDRSAASPLAFGTDARIDDDLGAFTAPNAFWFSSSATDGVSWVYAAIVVTDPGPYSDIYVRASSDGGRTFGTPVRASGVPAGTRINAWPVLAATPDGNVYMAYESQAPNLSGGAKQLRFNVSHDFGGTWAPADRLLSNLVEYANGHYGFYYNPATQVRAVDGGTAFVSYTDGDDVFLARTSDAGTSFDFNKDVDQDSRDYNYLPRLCVSGNNVILTFVSPNVGFNVYSVWGTSSADGGTTFATPLQLRPESAPNGVSLQDLACGTTTAVAIWEDFRNGAGELYASRFNGSAWEANIALPKPAGAIPFFPTARFVEANRVVVSWISGNEIWVNRSDDGGQSFPTFQRLDDAAPVPDAPGSDPICSSDKAGNVWVSWLDQSAGFREPVARASVDGGATFGPVRRLATNAPQGVTNTSRFSIVSPSTLPGAAFFTWNGFDDARFSDALITVFDVTDVDRDLTPAVSDCDDEDAGVSAVPIEIVSLTLTSLGANLRLDWTSQDATAGPDTVYDIATGRVSDLRTSGGFGGAACLVGDVPAPPYDEPFVLPPAGDADWSLVRARNGCGTGSFGDSTTVPDPRDDLDLDLACP